MYFCLFLTRDNIYEWDEHRNILPEINDEIVHEGQSFFVDNIEEEPGVYIITLEY
jgi:hypothetical protein